MRKIAVLLAVGLLSLLTACAHSPQQLTVRPVLEISGDSWGNGQPLRVTARDGRSDKVIGTLGGIYGNSSTITVANDIEEAMVSAANALLASKGFVVNSRDPNAVQLTIVIDELRYQDLTEDDKVGKAVKMVAALRAEGERNGDTFSARYQTASDYRGVTAPSMKDNEKRLNKLLEQTLQRMFNDEKLRDFLLQAGPAAISPQGEGILQSPILLP